MSTQQEETTKRPGRPKGFKVSEETKAKRAATIAAKKAEAELIANRLASEAAFGD